MTAIYRPQRDLTEAPTFSRDEDLFATRRAMAPAVLVPPPDAPAKPPTYAEALRKLLRATTCRDHGPAGPSAGVYAVVPTGAPCRVGE